jgi:hypothetical protein
MMKRIVLMLALLALPTVCSAQIYQWVDDNGQVNFSDDMGNIPAKYRKKAVQLDRQEEAVEISEKVEPDKEPRKGAEKKAPVAADDKGVAKEKPLYGGKDGETWKREFARQKFELKSLTDQAAGFRERMANPGKISRGEYLSLQHSLRDAEYRIAASQQKLDALNAAADQADLPAEFR